MDLGFVWIPFVRAGNEVIGLNLTWAHNLFMKLVLGFGTKTQSNIFSLSSL